MNNASGIPSKRPAPFSFDYPSNGLKRPALEVVGEGGLFSMTRQDGQPPWTAIGQCIYNPWAQDSQDVSGDFPPTANITNTHLEAENAGLTSGASHLYHESMFGAFADSHEMAGLYREASHRDESVEDLASLPPFLDSEASRRDISNLRSINEAEISEGSPSLLSVYEGTAFSMFSEPERETRKPWAFSPRLSDTPYETSAVTMEGCESHSGEMDTEVDMICYGMVCRFFLSNLSWFTLPALTIIHLYFEDLWIESTTAR